VRFAWLFGLAAVLWGIPYLLVELTVDEVSPAFVVFARSALGACVLVPLVLRGGRLALLRGRTRQVLWLALLDLAAPALLITIGLAAVPSSLAGTLVASVPLMVAVLALRYAPGERVTGLRLFGLVIGLGGVALLLGAEVAGNARALIGGLLVLAAALFYAGGALYFQRRFADLPPLVVVAGTLVGCAVLSAVPAALDPPQVVPSPVVVGALVVLGAGCTGLGYVAFYSLVAGLGAARASVVTYLAPAIAVFGGVVVLDEPLTAAIVAGLLLVLAGAWLSSGRPPRALRPAVRRRTGRPVRADASRLSVAP
jgi:drug/metabolite transporter (DMT)-like permease